MNNLREKDKNVLSILRKSQKGFIELYQFVSKKEK